MQGNGHYHVFSLPPALLSNLTPRNLIVTTRVSLPHPAVTLSSIGARGCNICLGITFSDVEEQRTHFRSDWHRYNVKIRLKGGTVVTEANFTQMLDGLDDSISGSESTSDSDESEDSDAVAALMNKVKVDSRSSSPTNSPTIPQSAIAWFHSPPATQIGIYKALFSKSAQPESYISELCGMQGGVNDGRKWAMFMVAGGHFAGAVVRVSRPEEEVHDESQDVKKPKQKKPNADIEVLKHKTFHRYTTRRKQGGSQGLNDNAKGNAKSAGAQLRRYGEQALRDDIRNLLQEWSDEIDDCERIWIRASGTNRKIFLDYEGSVINKGDERLRTFPFPTRRPTQSELLRCLLELTKVKISHLTEEALRAQDEAYLAALPKPRPVPVSAAPEPEKVKQPKLTEHEQILREKWNRLLEMINKGRLDPLKGFWDREGSALGGVDVPIPEWTGERRGTLLQVATEAGQEEVVKWLLDEAHADPTIDVPVGPRAGIEDDNGHHSDASDAAPARTVGSRRTAYDLARSRNMRDVFRRCAAAEPERWDWFGTARVPSALSKDMEEERDEKKKLRRKGLKGKLREREAREKDQERDDSSNHDAAVEVSKTAVRHLDLLGPRKVGGSGFTVETIAGLSPEMRVKVERERRARAAEARLNDPSNK